MLNKIVFGLGLLAVVAAEVYPVGYSVYQPNEIYPYAYQGVQRRLAPPTDAPPVTQKSTVEILVPKTQIDVVEAKVGLVSSICSAAFAVGHHIISFVFSNLPNLLIGAAITMGVCKFSPLCSSLPDVESLEDLREYVTPRRVERAAHFIHQAIEKFNALQESLE